MNQIAEIKVKSVITDMASRFGMERTAFESTLAKTIIKNAEATNEQVAAFLVVAKQYDLNPFTKEIYAFPARGGGIQPIVSVDGWLKIINNHKNFDGMEFVDAFEDGKLTAVTCKMHRKDRSHPVEVTEYMSECKRNTDPWKQYPARMLRHKATIQAARYAFSFSGIVDPDEAERIIEMGDAELVGEITGEIMDMDKIERVVLAVKEIIDLDDLDSGYQEVTEQWGSLTNDEKMKGGSMLKDKAKDSKRMYSTILPLYLKHVPEV